MSTTCPNGHESEWPDWCSICGERLGDGAIPAPAAARPAATPSAPAAASPSSPAATPAGATCSNCGVPRHEHDVFCESCGYDFASGSLPEGATPQAAVPDSAGATAQPIAPDAAPMHVKISVDPEFFENSIGDVDLTLPDPLPEVQMVPLAGIRILIGRQSTSRGIFPEIDVRALTDDPAVSSRHAMLERDSDNNWTLTDLGSTNGTFLTTAADEEIEAGTALAIDSGTAIYLGAWTRIDLAETTQ